MTKKKLIFDMDGTLLDSMAMWNNFIDLYNDYDMSNINRNFIPNMENSSSLSYTVQLVKDYVDEIIPDERIAQQVHWFLYDFYSSSDMAKSNVYDTLRQLKSDGYELFLATATDYAYAIEGLKSAKLYEFFTKLYTPDSLGAKKHTVEYYELITKDLGINPEDAIFFDDALYALEFAKEHGYRTIGVYDHNSTENEEVKSFAEYFVDDFSQIKDIINNF